jgi:NAD(P)-dependent dehydrogenase (short-subunit alcohol dehydrogenase family)
MTRRAASWKRRNEAAGRPIALITGASRGIGAATAQALAAGAHVIITARDAKALEGVEQAIHEAGGTATIAPMDLTETDAIARLAKAVAERWGKLDVLVVNAGVLPRSPRHRHRPQGLQPRHRHQHAGHPGPAHQLRSAAAQGGGGRVIGLTTSVATRPRAFWGAYAATKAAQEVLLDCYAQEVGNISPVKVAIVDPGATRTAMRARAYPGEDPMSLKTPDVVAKAILALLGEDFASPHRIRVYCLGGQRALRPLQSLTCPRCGLRQRCALTRSVFKACGAEASRKVARERSADRRGSARV